MTVLMHLNGSWNYNCTNPPFSPPPSTLASFSFITSFFSHRRSNARKSPTGSRSGCRSADVNKVLGFFFNIWRRNEIRVRFDGSGKSRSRYKIRYFGSGGGEGGGAIFQDRGAEGALGGCRSGLPSPLWPSAWLLPLAITPSCFSPPLRTGTLSGSCVFLLLLFPSC